MKHPLAGGRTHSGSGALKTFALKTPFPAGAGLVLVVSDLFDDAPLAACAWPRSRLGGSDAELFADRSLRPTFSPKNPASSNSSTLETGERLNVGPDEVQRLPAERWRVFMEHTRRVGVASRAFATRS